MNQEDVYLKHSNILPHRFIIDLSPVQNFRNRVLLQIEGLDVEMNSMKMLFPYEIKINEALFSIEANAYSFLTSIIKQEEQLMLFCSCQEQDNKLCEHQAKALNTVARQSLLLIFFDEKLRHEKLKTAAYDFGLENEADLDQHFLIELINNKLEIKPRESRLVAVTKSSLTTMRSQVYSETPSSIQALTPDDSIVVFKNHKYYRHLLVALYKAQTTKEGKIKNPLNLLHPNDFIWSTSDPKELKFLMGLNRFQNYSEDKISEADLLALKAVIKNPSGYPFYIHHSEISESVNSGSLEEVQVKVFRGDLVLTVAKTNHYFEISGKVTVEENTYDLKDLALQYHFFLGIGNVLYLIDKLPVIRIIGLLKQKSGNLLILPSKYAEFKADFLDKIEDHITIDYHYIEDATSKQLAKFNFFDDREQIIYLSDFGSYVMIIPVMRYSDVEIQVRTKRQVYGMDQDGKEFLVKRNDDAEVNFMSLLIKQHPDFEEQLENSLHYFYLHKKRFLDEDWFLRTFEEWRNHHITILGFNELEGNKFNQNKIKVDIKVLSGLNWFNVKVEARFGKKKAPLKKLHIALKNKSKYIKLDDGTLGILPQEWIEKFSVYFTTGDLVDEETLAISKSNFSIIEELFQEENLEETVKREVELYRDKAYNFTTIDDVEVPKELNGTLRPYQKQGLNWLNFLDDFNFGGCLADDMGLGKSIQIIAFILLQRSRAAQNANLLIVPTTLIFNWKAEMQKFAPDLKVLVFQGADRVKHIPYLDQFEVVLLSYNTLLSDVQILKKFFFNYIFLDESQQIKNPESQRYKAARMLKSRNRIAITGTPVENNAFDIFSQLSFACPGLLGTKQHFKRLYSVPIDKFKDKTRAKELKHKIKPFLLRRTKQEVAKELPDKTEVILYCEMGEEQRNIYNAYEKEFREYISATNDEEIKKSQMNVLKGLTKLRQICNSTKLLKSNEISGEGCSSKIKTLIEQIEDNAEHHKMLVFSQFVSMLDLIKKELVERKIGFAILTGSTKNRETVVNDFQNNNDIRVFLISLKAGGTGLNLVEASYVYLVDPWWNPAVENQAIDRSHRIGQHENVTATRLICPDTVEEKIIKLQESKKDLVSQLIKEEGAFLQTLSKRDLLRLLQ